MSTLSIARQRTPHHDQRLEVASRFSALTHDARCVEPSRIRFGEVFDLDYGQSRLEELSGPLGGLGELAPVEQPALPLVSGETTAPAAPAARRPRLRLTRRGRVALTLAFLGAALALMVPLSGLATATLAGGDPEPVRVIEVGPGDTLYGLAGELAQPGHVREMVHRIQELNSLPDAQIEEGQKLAVPAS